MSERNTANEWTGPSAGQMIKTHTLAKETINHHGGRTPVFDDLEIIRLRRFVQDPTQAEQLLAELDLADGGAWRTGSLAAHIIKTWGTDKSALTQDEVDALKEWYDNGGGKTAEELAEGRQD